MDFKEFRDSKLKRTKKNKVDLILEGLDQEIETVEPKTKEILEIQASFQKKPDFKFIGKLHETPNPLEYEDGVIYKNTRSGIAYIKSGDLWESLVEDGRPGTQGPQGRAGGSGVGVYEVTNITNDIIKTYTNSTVTSSGTVSFPNKLKSVQILNTQPRFGSVVKSHNGGAGTIAGQFTFGDQIPLTSPILGFKPFWVNLAGVPKTISAAKAAAASTTLADGATLTWKKLSVSGMSTFTVPKSNGGSYPGIIVGDFIPLQSIPRTDFPERSHILQIRTFYNDGLSIPFVGGCAGYATTMGLDYATYFGGAFDNVTSPSGSPTLKNNAYCGVGIIPIYKEKVVDILLGGDSTNAGTSSTCGIFGCGDYAKREGVKEGILLDIYKIANGGLSSKLQFSAIKSCLDANIKPNFALIQTWSINDGTAVSAFDASFAYALESAYLCILNGITPILQTPPPNNALYGSSVTKWVNLFNDVKNLATTHIVADCTTSIMDPLVPSHFLEIYDSGDGTHPNQLGHEIRGEALLETIRSIYN